MLTAVSLGAIVRPTLAQTPAAVAPSRVGEIKSLGNDRYLIGRIVVNKRGRSLAVPGRVNVIDKPLEYLATTPDGRRAYESLLTLDTSGSELNLACILIGLERDPRAPLSQPLSQPGPLVLLSVAWTDAAGQRRQVSAAEALLGVDASAKDAAIDWAYTGSFSSIDGKHLAADQTGSLISFVKKDPSGIFEAVSGVGLGAYGTVRGNASLPPEGSPIELVVEAAVPRK